MIGYNIAFMTGYPFQIVQGKTSCVSESTELLQVSECYHIDRTDSLLQTKA